MNLQSTQLALKIDIDTERGTRLGIPALLSMLDEFSIPATFLFSLGPDNTGRALKRIFRPGFFKKVQRTSVISTYGIRTLLNGVLWPGPHIAKRHRDLMRSVKHYGHETGIHCYDHIRWQDNLHNMSQIEVLNEFQKAQQTYFNVFDESAFSAGSAGWQANAFSLNAYDQANLLYGSDTRGQHPFIPMMNGITFKTPQIPTTLPTLDEVLGLPNYPYDKLADYFISLIKPNQLNVLTIHAELEGLSHQTFFRRFLAKACEQQIQFVRLIDVAQDIQKNNIQLPFHAVTLNSIAGRAGTLAVQS